MSKRNKQKASVREQKQARQARRIVNGIFIGLILLMIIGLMVFYLLMGN